jgi:hypothetical protein
MLFFQCYYINLKTEANGAPKRWYPTVKLHGVTTRKTLTWMLTAHATNRTLISGRFPQGFEQMEELLLSAAECAWD